MRSLWHSSHFIIHFPLFLLLPLPVFFLNCQVYPVFLPLVFSFLDVQISSSHGGSGTDRVKAHEGQGDNFSCRDAKEKRLWKACERENKTPFSREGCKSCLSASLARASLTYTPAAERPPHGLLITLSSTQAKERQQKGFPLSTPLSPSPKTEMWCYRFLDQLLEGCLSSGVWCHLPTASRGAGRPTGEVPISPLLLFPLWGAARPPAPTLTFLAVPPSLSLLLHITKFPLQTLSPALYQLCPGAGGCGCEELRGRRPGAALWWFQLAAGRAAQPSWWCLWESLRKKGQRCQASRGVRRKKTREVSDNSANPKVSEAGRGGGAAGARAGTPLQAPERPWWSRGMFPGGTGACGRDLSRSGKE